MKLDPQQICVNDPRWCVLTTTNQANDSLATCHPVSINIVVSGTAIVLRLTVPPLIIARRDMAIAVRLALTWSTISRVTIVIFLATPLTIAVRLTSWVSWYIKTLIPFPLLIITLTVIVVGFSVMAGGNTISGIRRSYVDIPTQIRRWIVLRWGTIMVTNGNRIRWVVPITNIVIGIEE